MAAEPCSALTSEDARRYIGARRVSLHRAIQQDATAVQNESKVLLDSTLLGSAESPLVEVNTS